MRTIKFIILLSLIVTKIIAQDDQNPPIDQPIQGNVDPQLPDYTNNQDLPTYEEPRYPDIGDVGINNQNQDDIPIVYDEQGDGLLYRQSNTREPICICVPIGKCINGSSNYGDDDLNPRLSIVTSGVISNGIQHPVPTDTAAARLSTSCSNNVALELCCFPGPYACGTQYPAVKGSPPLSEGQAYFGQFPWQAVILDKNDIYLGSGALIDNFNVVTAAHRIANITQYGNLKVRLGEWDASGNREPIPAQEFSISRVVIHPEFNAKNLRNSIAMIRLKIGVPLGLTPTINNICLPTANFISGTCYVSGWGKNDFRRGSYQAIQKITDLPLVDTNKCQAELRNTRLGSSFVLDPYSFMCAGGIAGKDACTGDGGAPLVCQQGGKWYLAGLVGWGIGCGENSVPGVYINITNYIPWMMNLTQF